MTSKSIYFCVYRITNLVENKHYYGYKSSKIHPSKVIGITYFSSSKGESGKDFIIDQKKNPQNYKYKIVQLFDSPEQAINREIKLHLKFNVKCHPQFYNKSNQTSSKFDTTGTTMSIEARNKMSIAGKGKPKSESHKENMRGRKHTDEELIKMSIALTGKVKSESHIKNMRLSFKINKTNVGTKNARFKQYYHTPWGIFETHNIKYFLNLINVCCPIRIFLRCVNSDDLISKQCFTLTPWFNKNYTWEDIEGKSFRDLGFYTIHKDKIEPFMDEIIKL